MTEAIEMAVESGGIEPRKEKAMLSPRRWTPVRRYKKAIFFFFSSHVLISQQPDGAIGWRRNPNAKHSETDE